MATSSLSVTWLPNPITLPDLTTASVDGTGAFDVLMKSTKAHLEQEFTKGRIKGTEYATVYLGSLEQVLRASVDFLLAKDKVGLEAKLLEAQIELAQIEKDKALIELQIAQMQLQKVPAEIALLEAQAGLVRQQTLTEVEQTKVATAQECKLRAEFDVLMETKIKTANEAELLNWKTATEKAQTLSTGVDTDSVIGKQKLLYGAQATGFTRDAEQKAAKIMVDAWNVRRTTDSAEVPNEINKLDNSNIGRAVSKLLTGVGA